MNKLILLSPVLLTACQLPQISGDVTVQALEGGAMVATGFGPYGAIAGLALSTAAGCMKWYQHKTTAKAVIESTQLAKSELSLDAQDILREGYKTYTPTKIQKYVDAVKKNI